MSGQAFQQTQQTEKKTENSASLDPSLKGASTNSFSDADKAESQQQLMRFRNSAGDLARLLVPISTRYEYDEGGTYEYPVYDTKKIFDLFGKLGDDAAHKASFLDYCERNGLPNVRKQLAGVIKDSELQDPVTLEKYNRAFFGFNAERQANLIYSHTRGFNNWYADQDEILCGLNNLSQEQKTKLNEALVSKGTDLKSVVETQLTGVRQLVGRIRTSGTFGDPGLTANDFTSAFATDGAAASISNLAEILRKVPEKSVSSVLQGSQIELQLKPERYRELLEKGLPNDYKRAVAAHFVRGDKAGLEELPLTTVDLKNYETIFGKSLKESLTITNPADSLAAFESLRALEKLPSPIPETPATTAPSSSSPTSGSVTSPTATPAPPPASPVPSTSPFSEPVATPTSPAPSSPAITPSAPKFTISRDPTPPEITPPIEPAVRPNPHASGPWQISKISITTELKVWREPESGQRRGKYEMQDYTVTPDKLAEEIVKTNQLHPKVKAYAQANGYSEKQIADMIVSEALLSKADPGNNVQLSNRELLDAGKRVWDRMQKSSAGDLQSEYAAEIKEYETGRRHRIHESGATQSQTAWAESAGVSLGTLIDDAYKNPAYAMLLEMAKVEPNESGVRTFEWDAICKACEIKTDTQKTELKSDFEQWLKTLGEEPESRGTDELQKALVFAETLEAAIGHLEVPKKPSVEHVGDAITLANHREINLKNGKGVKILDKDNKIVAEIAVGADGKITKTNPNTSPHVDLIVFGSQIFLSALNNPTENHAFSLETKSASGTVTKPFSIVPLNSTSPTESTPIVKPTTSDVSQRIKSELSRRTINPTEESVPSTVPAPQPETTEPAKKEETAAPEPEAILSLAI